MTLRNALNAVVALTIGIALLAVFAVVGALTTATTAVIVGGGLYVVGLVSMGTAQGIVIAIAVIGAVIGVISGVATMVTA